MDAVTYPDLKVIPFMKKYVVPVRLSFDAKPESEDFEVKWTPTFVVVDADGTEHHRAGKFLAPGEFIPMILLGIGKTHFDRQAYEEAMASLDRLLRDYPQSDSAPEAIYYRQVSESNQTIRLVAMGKGWPFQKDAGRV